MQICWMTASELHDALRRREFSAVELLDATLTRCDRLGPLLRPFSVLLETRARAAAEAADRRLADGTAGPLTGLPVTVKDSQWMAGVESTHGSRTMEGFVPAVTCRAVERLQQAGAVIFAKTAVPEFCYFGITASDLLGVTSNPWSLERTPGGSSGGCAAAVGSGLGPLSLGGDGGGSIRIPAAFSGVVGFKPTFGLVPREPCATEWKSLVALGPITRSVADVRLMLRPMLGADPADRHSVAPPLIADGAADLRGVRVAASLDLGFAPVDADVATVFLSAVERIEQAGAEVVWDAPGLASSVRVWATIACADARWAEAEAYERRRDDLGERTAAFLEFGDSITSDQYVRAQAARDGIHQAYADLFARTGAEVLLTPTLGCEAFPHGSTHPASIGGVEIAPPWLDWAGFLYDANLAGLPALALPIGFGDEGLPVSMQLLGPRMADSRVLAVAEAVEGLLGRMPAAPEPGGVPALA